MASATSTGSWLDPPELHGKRNSDGSFTLTELELKRLNDYNRKVAKMIQGGLNLANLNGDTNKVFADIEGNVTELSITAEGLATSVSNLNGDVSTLEQTASGLSTSVTNLNTQVSAHDTSISTLTTNVSTVTQTANGLTSTVSSLSGDVSSLDGSVSNLSSNLSTVTQTVNGLGVTTSGGTTYITGDHVKTGTISGVNLESTGGVSKIFVNEGSIEFNDTMPSPYTTQYAVAGHSGYDGKLHIETAWIPLKIVSGSNMSIDSSGTIYIGSSAGYTGNVDIGQSGGVVNINGSVYINGVLQ